MFALGSWDECLTVMTELPEEEWLQVRQIFAGLASVGVLVHVHRGRYDEANRIVDVYRPFETSADIQEQAGYHCGKASLLLARGDPAAALPLAEAAFAVREGIGISVEYIKESFVIAVEAALRLGDADKAEALIGAVDGLPPGRHPQFLRAQSSRFKARLAQDSSEAERHFKGASGLFRELAVPFYLAVTQLEHAEWLVAGAGREADPLLAEAREIFERLGAVPWLERMEAVGAPRPAEARA